MRKKLFKLICLIIISAFILSALSTCISAQNAWYKKALPLPELSGEYAQDIVAVAQSQVGYKEAGDGSTVYAAEISDPFQNWGAEFISWCARNAGIPTLVFPEFSTISDIRNYFARQGLCYYLKEGMDKSKFDLLKGFRRKPTISASKLRPGDIIVSKDPKDGAGALSVFISRQYHNIKAVTGNSDRAVEITDIHEKYICGVIRPDYELRKTQVTKTIGSVDWWGSTHTVYTGEKTVPDITLYDRQLKRRLVKGRDYTVSVKNAIGPGTAEIIFRGKGIYTGKYTFTYTIRPAEPVLSYSRGSSKIKLTWKDVAGADRYVLFKYNRDLRKYVETMVIPAGKESCVIKCDLSVAHKFYLRAYVKGPDGRYYYTDSPNLTVRGSR